MIIMFDHKLNQSQQDTEREYLNILFQYENNSFVEVDLSTPVSKFSEANIISKIHSYRFLEKVHIYTPYIDSLCLVNKVFYDTLGRCNTFYKKGITDYYYVNNYATKAFQGMVDSLKDFDLLLKRGSYYYFKGGKIICLDTLNSRVRTICYNHCGNPEQFMKLVFLVKNDKRFQKAFYLSCGAKYYFIKSR